MIYHGTFCSVPNEGQQNRWYILSDCNMIPYYVTLAMSHFVMLYTLSCYVTHAISHLVMPCSLCHAMSHLVVKKQVFRHWDTILFIWHYVGLMFIWYCVGRRKRKRYRLYSKETLRKDSFDGFSGQIRRRRLCKVSPKTNFAVCKCCWI